MAEKERRKVRQQIAVSAARLVETAEGEAHRNFRLPQ